VGQLRRGWVLSPTGGGEERATPAGNEPPLLYLAPVENVLSWEKMFSERFAWCVLVRCALPLACRGAVHRNALCCSPTYRLNRTSPKTKDERTQGGRQRMSATRKLFNACICVLAFRVFFCCQHSSLQSKEFQKKLKHTHPPSPHRRAGNTRRQ
jgi:hypothetical protein